MRYLILFFLCLATVIAYVQRSAMNGATKAIETDFSLSPQDLGLVMSGWYLLYSLFQLPGGWIADRLGSKKALVILSITWSGLTGLSGLAGGWLGLLLIWSLMGAAQAGIFPSCTKAIGTTFPKTQQAFAAGMLGCCMSLGAALSPAVTGQLLGVMTWQKIFMLYAIPGLVWALVFAALIPRPDSIPHEKPPGDSASGAEPPARPPAPRPRWSRLLTDRQMLLLCFQQFLRAGAMVFFFTWFARFLQEAKGLSAEDAGGLAFWPPFVGAFGGLTGGLISDWIYRRTGNSRLARQGTAFVALIGCTGAAAAAYFIADPALAVLLISVGSFCGYTSGVSAYALAIAYGGKRVAIVFGAMNMSGNLGATVFPTAVAAIVASTGNWNHALLLFVLLFGVAAVCWLFLNPQGTLFEEGE